MIELAEDKPAVFTDRQDDLVDAAQLAKRLDIPRSWIKEQSDQGVLPCLRLGQRTRYSVAEIASVLRRMACDTSPRAKRRRKPRAVASPMQSA